jgi:hypothetical protein
MHFARWFAMGVKKKSRSVARKEDAAIKKAEREAGVGGYVPADYTRCWLMNTKDTVSTC